ncbi:MAG: hypothetical protein JNM62_14660 [Flavobacteriales bacterium]|nr:hypothetical protein [Flavobacteriales bacterium]
MSEARVALIVLHIILFAACTGAPEQKAAEPIIEHGSGPVVFAALNDNIRHDTLLIQTTFDMGDSTYLMVAGHVEPKFEGIRLYRYELLPDSNARILAYSNGAYDSWTMLPTFFSIPNPPGTHLILANFGERESWGQKLMFMDSAFTDLGFLDVAFPEHITEGDSTYVKRTNAAPFGRLALHNDTAVFTFACDSLFLYDDMAGHNDLIVPAQSIRYTYHPESGLELWQNGQRRAVKQPS